MTAFSGTIQSLEKDPHNSPDLLGRAVLASIVLQKLLGSRVSASDFILEHLFPWKILHFEKLV